MYMVLLLYSSSNTYIYAIIILAILFEKEYMCSIESAIFIWTNIRTHHLKRLLFISKEVKSSREFKLDVLNLLQEGKSIRAKDERDVLKKRSASFPRKVSKM